MCAIVCIAQVNNSRSGQGREVGLLRYQNEKGKRGRRDPPSFILVPWSDDHWISCHGVVRTIRRVDLCFTFVSFLYCDGMLNVLSCANLCCYCRYGVNYPQLYAVETENKHAKEFNCVQVSGAH